MTDEMMSLRTLLEKSADADLLREMVGFAAQRRRDTSAYSGLWRSAECQPMPKNSANPPEPSDSW
jgi:putative transposase